MRRASHIGAAPRSGRPAPASSVATHAAVAERAEVLGRIQAERRRPRRTCRARGRRSVAPCACAQSSITATPCARAGGADRVDVGRLAVEMHRDHGADRRQARRRMRQHRGQFGRVHRVVQRARCRSAPASRRPSRSPRPWRRRCARPSRPRTPGPMPSARSASASASVPLPQPTACAAPSQAANSASNARPPGRGCTSRTPSARATAASISALQRAIAGAGIGLRNRRMRRSCRAQR